MDAQTVAGAAGMSSGATGNRMNTVNATQTVGGALSHFRNPVTANRRQSQIHKRLPGRLPEVLIGLTSSRIPDYSKSSFTDVTGDSHKITTGILGSIPASFELREAVKHAHAT
jgi:hypothetical protein